VHLESHGEPDRGHQGDHEDVPHQVGEGSPGQHGRPCHREGLESLQQSRLHIGGEAHSGPHGPEHDGLDEDAGDQIVDV
jgi:hypothetical protein